MELLNYYLRHSSRPGRIKLGICFGILQHVSNLLAFVSMWLGFTWMSSFGSKEFIICVSLMIVGFVISFLTAWASNYLIAGEAYVFHRDLRLKIASKLKDAPMSYFTKQHLSKISNCLCSSISKVEMMTGSCFNTTVQAWALGCFLLLGIFGTSWILGLIMLAMLALYAFIIKSLYSSSKKHVTQLQNRQNHYASRLINSINGVAVLRAFPQSKGMANKLHSRLEESSLSWKEQLLSFEKSYVLHEKLAHAYLGLASIIFSLASLYLCSLGLLELASALLLSLIGIIIFNGLATLLIASVLLSIVPAHAHEIESTLINCPALKEGSITHIVDKPELEFKGVNFSYEPTRPLIKDLSFKLHSGQKLALIGPSGSGKSTIINLIARFWEPDSGEILLGGHKLSEYSYETLLKELSLVFQDVYLFNDSIANNIRIAKPEATDEELIEVCKRARCHDFIMQLPLGYQSIVGEGGSRLSGGEKQRISIARALLKDASIILLDEATSSVDPENETEIIMALEELCKEKTIISIAHRLSTVESADKILAISDGCLVQEGSHDELKNVEGIYKSFLNARKQAANWSLG